MLRGDTKHEYIASYFFDVLRMDLTNFSNTVEQSVAFCATLLEGLKNSQPYILKLWFDQFDELLPQIESEQDFSVAVRMSRLLEQPFLDDYWAPLLQKKLVEKVRDTLDVLPDDHWRVRVLSQLTKRCIKQVFLQLDFEMSQNIKDTSENVLGGERILTALGREEARS